MPPKAKFTKEEIIGAGLAILRERDISAVTAREIGNYLGSSARPIFTVFDNMGEVLNGIEAKAREIYSEYVEQGLQQTPAFKGVGQSYIQFAINEPKLFQLLFMRKTSGNIGINRILPEIDDNYTDILKSITDEYPVSADDAVILYRHLWIYSHGIATLCATSMCRFTEDEIGIMLTEVFKALLTERLKSRGLRIGPDDYEWMDRLDSFIFLLSKYFENRNNARIDYGTYTMNCRKGIKSWLG